MALLMLEQVCICRLHMISWVPQAYAALPALRLKGYKVLLAVFHTADMRLRKLYILPLDSMMACRLC